MTISVSPRFSVMQDQTRIAIYHAQKGEGIPQHQHAYSHLTMCHAGRILVRKEGKQLEMTKNSQPANLVADEWHEIEALEDGTVFVNIFAEGKG